MTDICPKCGFNDPPPDERYHSSALDCVANKKSFQGEHLHLTCLRCSAEWSKAPEEKK